MQFRIAKKLNLTFQMRNTVLDPGINSYADLEEMRVWQAAQLAAIQIAAEKPVV